MLRSLIIISALFCAQLSFADSFLSMPRLHTIKSSDWLNSSHPNLIKQSQKEDLLIELFKSARTASEIKSHPIYIQISKAMYTENSLYFNDWLLAVRSIKNDYPDQTLNFVSLQQNKWLDKKFPFLEADLNIFEWSEALVPSLALTASAIYSVVHFRNKGVQNLTSGIPKGRSLKFSRRIMQHVQRRAANQVGRHGLRNTRYAGTSVDNQSSQSDVDESSFTQEFIPVSPAQFVYSSKGAHSMGLGYEEFHSYNKMWGLSSGLIALYVYDKYNPTDNKLRLSKNAKKMMTRARKGFLAKKTARLVFRFPLFKITAGLFVSIAADKAFTWSMDTLKNFKMNNKFTQIKKTLLNSSFDSKVQAYSFLDTYSMATQELASYHTHPVWSKISNLMADYHKRYYCNSWNMKKVAGLEFYNVALDKSSYPEKLNESLLKNEVKLKTITHLYNESIHNISQFKGLGNDAYTEHLINQLKLQRENIQPKNLHFILNQGLEEIRQEIDHILTGDELYTYQEIAKDLNCIGVSDLRNFIIKKNEK